MAKMTPGNSGKCTGLLGVEILNHELLPGPSLRSRGCHRLEGGFWGLQRPPPTEQDGDLGAVFTL